MLRRSLAYLRRVVYLEPVASGHKGWPASTIVDGIPDIESIDYALRHTKYGQCVYESDNNVCDNQVGPPTTLFRRHHFTQMLSHRS
jgi:hypothetical protein